MKNIVHLELPYQWDVTALTGIVNLLISKMIEVAEDQMVDLPPEVQLYDRVDLVDIADAMRNVSVWQADIVNQLGLSSDLIPKVFENIDYNSVGSKTTYFQAKINDIIDALDNQTQQEPGNYQ